MLFGLVRSLPFVDLYEMLAQTTKGRGLQNLANDRTPRKCDHCEFLTSFSSTVPAYQSVSDGGAASAEGGQGSRTSSARRREGHRPSRGTPECDKCGFEAENKLPITIINTIYVPKNHTVRTCP